MKVFHAATHPSKNGIGLDDADAVRARIMDGDIAVLDNVFSPALARSVRKEVIAWACQNEPWDGNALAGSTPPANWYRRDINPERSATKRILQTHDFGNIFALGDPLKSTLLALFEPMVSLQSILSGRTLSLTDADGEARLHPQVIHYPRGGGYFGRHCHPLEPQRVGLIVALSARESDFRTGSTLYYRPDGSALDLDGEQSLGSVTAFRYDIPHTVTAVDCDAEIAFDDPGGRWVAIMPYH